MRMIVVVVIIPFVAMCFSGCSSLDQSKWESNLQANTRVFVEKPNVIETVDLSANLKRSW